MMQHTAAAALAVDRELLQEGHAGLHSLGAAEQGPDNTGAGSSANEAKNLPYVRQKECFILQLRRLNNKEYEGL